MSFLQILWKQRRCEFWRVLHFGQIAAFVGVVTPILGVLWFLFKIYKKIDNNDKLTRANLKATKVMLDHFIEDKIGNGEFKAARQEIDEVLIEKVG